MTSTNTSVNDPLVNSITWEWNSLDALFVVYYNGSEVVRLAPADVLELQATIQDMKVVLPELFRS